MEGKKMHGSAKLPGAWFGQTTGKKTRGSAKLAGAASITRQHCSRDRLAPHIRPRAAWAGHWPHHYTYNSIYITSYVELRCYSFDICLISPCQSARLGTLFSYALDLDSILSHTYKNYADENYNVAYAVKYS